MTTEQMLLNKWRSLPLDKQQEVLEFVEFLTIKRTPESQPTEYVPQTPLGRRLWEIRSSAIAAGEQLLTEEEIEQELAEQRGGYRD